MIIIVEGVDGSGKSTLLNRLYTDFFDEVDKIEFNGEAYIPTHPKSLYRISEKSLYTQLNKMCKDKTLYLVDRGPISDIIYRVFDNYKSVTTLDKLLNFISTHSKIFYIYCNTDKSLEAMTERGDDNPIAFEKHKELKKLYNIVMGTIKSKTDCFYEYDFTKKNSYNKLFKQIKMLLNWR